jgi:hypothetical protein
VVEPVVVGSLPRQVRRARGERNSGVQALSGRLPKMTGWQPVLPRVSELPTWSSQIYSRGRGVGRGLGVGVIRGAAVGVGVAVAVAVGVGVGLGGGVIFGTIA